MIFDDFFDIVLEPHLLQAKISPYYKQKIRAADAEIEQTCHAKQKAASFAKASQNRVDQEAAARQSAELEAAIGLEVAILRRLQIREEARIQKVVDDRQEAMRYREFKRADSLLEGDT